MAPIFILRRGVSHCHPHSATDLLRQSRSRTRSSINQQRSSLYCFSQLLIHRRPPARLVSKQKHHSYSQDARVKAHAAPSAGGPLAGVRVLDFTRILAGPYCTQLLADYGADVIKVEQPGKGDETRGWQAKGEKEAWDLPGQQQSNNTATDGKDVGRMSFFFASLNRNKRSVTLDLKSARGKDAVRRLVRSGAVDVVVENYVPGVMERLGLGYEALAELQPRLIYASISGYGASGPYGRRAGYDAVANAEGGLMHITGHGGEGGGPARTGVGVTDMAAGMLLHGAIMAALLHRERSGRGQKVGASLFETTVSMLTSVGAQWLNLGLETGRFGAGHPSVVPYNAWECGDGTWLVVAANSDAQFGVLCERLGRREWISDERFQGNADRLENREVLDGLIGEVVRTKRHEQWLEILDGSGLAHGPVNSIGKAFEHPQIEAREMVKELDWDLVRGGKWKAIGVPVKFSETKGEVRAPAPLLGQHSEEVLAKAGYGREEIEEMKRDRVI